GRMVRGERRRHAVAAPADDLLSRRPSRRGGPGLPDGRSDPEGRRRVRDLRQLQRAPARVARGLRFLQGGRVRGVRSGRPHRDRRGLALQHKRRDAVRELHAELEPPARAGAPAARRPRQPPGTGCRGRPVRSRRGRQVQKPHLHEGNLSMATARPVRAMDPYAEQFWAFTRDRELRLQQCSACGKFRWPPGPTCDRCLSDDFAWSPLSGAAKVRSWTTFRRGYFPEYPPPHSVVAVELDEGPLFISWPVGIEPTDLREGMTLYLCWTDATDRFGDYNLPVFGPSRKDG